MSGLRWHGAGSGPRSPRKSLEWGTLGAPKFLTTSWTFLSLLSQRPFKSSMPHRHVACPQSLPQANMPNSRQDISTSIPHLCTCPHTVCCPFAP